MFCLQNGVHHYSLLWVCCDGCDVWYCLACHKLLNIPDQFKCIYTKNYFHFVVEFLMYVTLVPDCVTLEIL